LQFEPISFLRAGEKAPLDYRDGTDYQKKTNLNGLSFLHLFLNDSPLDQILRYPARVTFKGENGTSHFQDFISFDYDRVNNTITPRPPT